MEQKDTIVVLGAKPEAIFPDIAPEFVVTANSAVELALEYRKKFQSKIIALVPILELRRHKFIQDSFVRSQPDEIVLLGAVPEDKEFVSELNLTNSKVEVLSSFDTNWGLVKQLGLGRFFIALDSIKKRRMKYFLFEALPDLLLVRKMEWMPRSTGINAVLYSLERFPKSKQIIVTGIAPQEGSHYNGVGYFTKKTADADLITLKHWKLEHKKNVYTTDEVLSRMGKFPLWSK
jgi:hypothetical protein